jgi:hypothetical protein
MKTLIRNSTAYKLLSEIRNLINWNNRKYAAPSPHFIKQACLIRNSIPNATWVETGTYLGSTTRLLSKHASIVYSIEPEPTLFANAKRYFDNFNNVEILNGTSEDIFPTLLPKITGNVNFWLDGHYSAGITFKGPKDTPIIDELKSISAHLSHFKKLTVLVDDIRCFNPHISEYSTYPSVDFLVDWARVNNLRWHIEHDIFVAKNH